MYEIHDSVNCVSSIEEFKWQMPDNVKILKEDNEQLPMCKIL